MSKANRIISLILLFSILFTLTQITYADESERITTDSEIELLSTLGILENTENILLDNEISREEFAVYIAGMLNVDVYVKATDRYFYDLPMDSYGSAAVNALTNMGIISQNDECKFRPDELITFDEACKMLVCSAGYKTYADAIGGYPQGYRQAASRLSIIDGVTIDETVTVDETLKMVYNTLFVNAFEGISYKDDSVIYAESDETVLSLHRDVFVSEGTVNGVYGQSLVTDNIESGEVLIGDIKLAATDDKYASAKYLGDYVEYYYKESNGQYELIYMIKDDTQKIAEFDMEQFAEYSSNTIYYYKDENGSKKTTLSLTKPTYVYNGEVVNSGINALFENVTDGRITVKDSNNDGSLDIVLIEDYKDFIVDSVKDNSAYSKNETERNNINFEEYECVKITDATGKWLMVSNITAGDILSVADTIGKSCITIIISRETVDGSYNAYNAADNTVKVDESKYEISKDFTEGFKNKVKEYGAYTFYLNSLGKISYAEAKADSNDKFAYLIDVNLDTAAWSSKMKLKVLTANSKIEVLDCADNLKIDGVSYKDDHTNAYKQLVTDAGNAKEILFVYKLNTDGEIYNIDTATVNEESESKQSSLNAIGGEEFDTYHYRYYRLGLTACITASTPIFCVPPEGADGSRDESGYFVGKAASVIEEDKSVSLNIYMTNNQNPYADAVVYKYAYVDLRANSTHKRAFVVGQVSDTIDADGCVVKSLSGYENGTFKTVQIPDGIDVSGLVPGDIVQFKYDVNGNITPESTKTEGFTMIYDYEKYQGGKPQGWAGQTDDRTYYAYNSNAQQHYYRDNLQLSYGYAARMNGSILWMGYKSGADENEVIDTSKTKIIVFDPDARTDEQKLYIGTVSDIITYDGAGADCSTIIYHSRASEPIATIVYK